MELQANIWYKQHRLEEARSEALRVADIYERFGDAEDAEDCRRLLQNIQKELDTVASSGQSDFDCEPL